MIAVAMGIAGACAAAVYGGVSVGTGWRNHDIATHVAVRERFVRDVRADGNLRAVTATPMTAPRNARLPLKLAWMVTDGSRVKKGDVVIRFDNSDLIKQVKDGEAARDTADSKIAGEQVRLNMMARNRSRSVSLAELELEQTRRFPRKSELIFSRNQIIESEIDEGLSITRMDHAQAVKSIEQKVTKGKLELLQVERKSADIKIRQAQEALESMEVVAPHDGIVVFRRDWRGNLPRVGNTVWAGQPLANIPLTESMEAEVFVLEADAGGLAEGKSAEVIVEAYPDHPYRGTVKRVDKLAKPRFSEVPIQYFAVVVTLEETDAKLMKPGQRIRATLVIDDREAIVLPRQAVVRKDDRHMV